MMGFKASSLILASVAVVAMTSGCGSSSNSSGGASSSGTSSAASSSSGTPSSGSAGGTAGGAPANIATLQSYVGAKGKANKAPITIGYVNLQGGEPSAPEAYQAAQAATAALNNDLGGIQGHQVKLEACHIVSSEEQGQECGQQLVNDPTVKLVITGAVQIGADALHHTIGGRLPTISGVPLNVSDVTSPNAFALNAGLFGSTPGEVTYAVKTLHAKKVAVIGATDDPAAVRAVSTTIAALKAAGVQATRAGFPQTATDVVAPLEAANVASADAIIAIVITPPTVIATAKALVQLGVKAPVLGIGSVLTPQVQSGLGDFPKWTYNFVSLNPAVPDADGQIAAYAGVMKKYQPSAPLAGDSTFTFGAFMTTAKILNSMKGALTTANIAAAFKAFTGPGYLDPPNYKFGSIPIGPGLGSLESRFYTYSGSNHWSDATAGKWIGPS
ncbi:MAG: ABC transporter substrate-binding protein [Solirubrobacterales bacterium]|nr:ABC transporter substrate-binding protein [Solirubrobacterales bacterium]